MVSGKVDSETESEGSVDSDEERMEPDIPPEMIESEDEETDEEIGLEIEKEGMGPHRNPIIVEALRRLRKQWSLLLRM